MLSIKEIAPEVFELTETIITANKDHTTNWYWDLNRSLISEKSSFPQPSILTRELYLHDIARFEKHYRPLLKS